MSPCFVYLSSDSSCVILVTILLCLRTNVIGQEQGKDAGSTLNPDLVLTSQHPNQWPTPLHCCQEHFFFLMHILVLIDHQPYGMIVLWVSLLLTAHSWSYNNYTRLWHCTNRPRHVWEQDAETGHCKLLQAEMESSVRNTSFRLEVSVLRPNWLGERGWQEKRGERTQVSHVKMFFWASSRSSFKWTILNRCL